MIYEPTITKTPSEIANLKSSWMADPCWDIETTEGFDAYHSELLEFSDDYYAKRDAAERKRLSDIADQLGIPGNIALAKYIDSLRSQVSMLRDEITQKCDSLWDEVANMRPRPERPTRLY